MSTLGDDTLTIAPCQIWSKRIHIIRFRMLMIAPDIKAGTVAVAAAITAGGVEAFQPYPAVTIAADRDEH